MCSSVVHHCWTCLCYQMWGMVVFVLFGCSSLLDLSVLLCMGDCYVCVLRVFTTAGLVCVIKRGGWLCLCSSGVYHCCPNCVIKHEGWLCLCSSGVHHCWIYLDFQMWGMVVFVFSGVHPCWTCLCYQTWGMVVFVFSGCSPLLDLSVLSNIGDGCVCVLRVFTTAGLVCAIKRGGLLCLCSPGVHHCCTCLCY